MTTKTAKQKKLEAATAVIRDVGFLRDHLAFQDERGEEASGVNVEGMDPSSNTRDEDERVVISALDKLTAAELRALTNVIRSTYNTIGCSIEFC